MHITERKKYHGFSIVDCLLNGGLFHCANTSRIKGIPCPLICNLSATFINRQNTLFLVYYVSLISNKKLMYTCCLYTKHNKFRIVVSSPISAQLSKYDVLCWLFVDIQGSLACPVLLSINMEISYRLSKRTLSIFVASWILPYRIWELFFP